MMHQRGGDQDINEAHVRTETNPLTTPSRSRLHSSRDLSENDMRIGIVGAGMIGSTLLPRRVPRCTRKPPALSTFVANSPVPALPIRPRPPSRREGVAIHRSFLCQGRCREHRRREREADGASETLHRCLRPLGVATSGSRPSLGRPGLLTNTGRRARLRLTSAGLPVERVARHGCGDDAHTYGVELGSGCR
jgi:hypothetical protein